MDDALALGLTWGPALPLCEASFRRRHCGGWIRTRWRFPDGVRHGLRANVAVRVLAGRSDHHKLEAVFKALGRALREACAADDRCRDDVPSLKGRIDNDRDR
jgi:imidazoleglycerol-phosphate dehydratase